MKSLAPRNAEAARHKFIANGPAIAEKMIGRALGDARDSQRAAERILESVGVLLKEPTIIINDPAQDTLAKLASLMAQQMEKQAQAIEQPKPSIEAEVYRVLGTGEG